MNHVLDYNLGGKLTRVQARQGARAAKKTRSRSAGRRRRGPTDHPDILSIRPRTHQLITVYNSRGREDRRARAIAVLGANIPKWRRKRAPAP